MRFVERLPKLRALAERSNWVRFGAFRSPFTPYESLVRTLEQDEAALKQLRTGIEAFKKDLQEINSIIRMAGTASDTDVFRFFDLWERNDGFIHAALRGQFRRSDFRLLPTSYKGPSRLIVKQDDDGDWVVAKAGGKFSSFLAVQSESDRPLQKEVAHALAYFDTGRIATYISAAEAETLQDSITEEILQEIEKTRKEISRFSVMISFSNSGKDPISFLPYAELVIKMSGLHANGEEVADDVIFILERRTNEKTLEPIQLQGNGATLEEFSSRDLIMNLKQSTAVMQAFDLGATTYKVRLFAAGGGAFSSSVYESESVRFAPSKFVLGSEGS